MNSYSTEQRVYHVKTLLHSRIGLHLDSVFGPPAHSHQRPCEVLDSIISMYFHPIGNSCIINTDYGATGLTPAPEF